MEAGDCELTVSDGLDGDEYSEELVEASKRLTDFIFEHHDTEAPPDLKLGEVQHAPVISEEMVRQNQADLPQYGYLGIHANTRARMFQNTNVPFASFVCGVQGSGKSHTTACMLGKILNARAWPCTNAITRKRPHSRI